MKANRTEVRNPVLRRTTFTCVTSVWNQGLNRTLNCPRNAAIRHIQLLREMLSGRKKCTRHLGKVTWEMYDQLA